MTPEAITNSRGEDLRERELRAILHISNMVGSVMALEEILGVIADTTAEVMGAPVCSIYLFDEDRARLRLAATHGLNPAVVGRATLEPGQGIPGWVALHGEILALKDGSADPRFSPIEGSDEEAYRGYLCAPLFIQTELIGAMTARKKGTHEFSPSEITLFETICKQVAIVIEKSRLHEAKIEAERLAAIGLSLSEISHYIKNVLQGIKSGAYFIESGLSRNDITRARRGWDATRRANRKIASLVENMLSYSRQSTPRLETIDLPELIYEIVGETEEMARRRNSLIEPDIDPDTPSIEADYEALHNAFLNLVTNALDAVEEKGGGTVHVRLAPDPGGRAVTLTVSDEGPGIPPEVMPNLFKLFFSTKGQRGTGIGLAVTRKLIEEMGGSIDVESTPGEGATFTCRFPVPETPPE